MGINTEYCYDLNGNQEFKCECKDGFDEKRCEVSVCPLDCNDNEICRSEIDEINGKKIWECECPFPFEGETIKYLIK